MNWWLLMARLVKDSPGNSMNKYDFTLMLKRSLELTDDLADALFAAGCEVERVRMEPQPQTSALGRNPQ